MSFWIFAAEAPNGNFLPGDINEFYWGTAAFFVVLIFIMWKVRPGVMKAFKASMKKTEEEVISAQESAKGAEEDFNQLKSKLSDMSAERERLLAAARVNSESIETELKAKADQDAIDLRGRVSMDVELAKMQAETEIKQQLKRAAFKAAEEIVLENLNAETQSKILDNYISINLAENPAKTSKTGK